MAWCAFSGPATGLTLTHSSTALPRFGCVRSPCLSLFFNKKVVHVQLYLVCRFNWWLILYSYLVSRFTPDTFAKESPTKCHRSSLGSWRSWSVLPLKTMYLVDSSASTEIQCCTWLCVHTARELPFIRFGLMSGQPSANGRHRADDESESFALAGARLKSPHSLGLATHLASSSWPA